MEEKGLLIWERNVTKIFWDQMLGERCRERNENMVLLWRGLKSVSVQEILSGKILPLLCRAVLQRLLLCQLSAQESCPAEAARDLY